MSATHDYRTAQTLAQYLTEEDVLVGESGGLSAVYAVRLIQDNIFVETEHGVLVFAKNSTVEVLDAP